MTKNCPFCASKNLETIEVDHDAWMVECLDCHATGPIGASRTSANVKWDLGLLLPSSKITSVVPGRGNHSQEGLLKNWQFVPKHPTPDMERAGVEAEADSLGIANQIYRAMLTAAPEM